MADYIKGVKKQVLHSDLNIKTYQWRDDIKIVIKTIGNFKNGVFIAMKWIQQKDQSF